MSHDSVNLVGDCTADNILLTLSWYLQATILQQNKCHTAINMLLPIHLGHLAKDLYGKQVENRLYIKGNSSLPNQVHNSIFFVVMGFLPLSTISFGYSNNVQSLEIYLLFSSSVYRSFF